MFTLTPTGQGFGAYVEGADLRGAPDTAALRALQSALDQHLVLIFRGLPRLPEADELVAFCSAIGPLRPSLADRSRLPDHPAINLVANRTVGDVQGSGGSQALHFHSDLHHEPPLIEFIYLDAVEVPAEGGDTKWVDLCAAYDALSDERKAQIDALVVHYALRGDLDFNVYFKASADGLAKRRKDNDVSLVQRNGRTGRKALWANTGPQSNHAAQIVGMGPDESEALLCELFEHCTHERFQLRHHWRAGEACLWHNVQTLHGRDAFPEAQTRIMRHVNILGIRDAHQKD